MKKAFKFSWSGFAVLVVLLIGWLFYGCGGGGGGSAGPQPGGVTGTAKIAAQIVDANNDALLSTGNGGPAGGFDVTFAANGSALGSAVNTKTGVVTYLSSNLPVGTVVSAEFVAKTASGNNDPNFLRSSKSFIVSQKGTNDFTNNKILITNLGNLPPDVVGDTKTGTADNNGAVATTVVLSPPPAAAGDPVPTVTIPAGAVLKDANGNPLTGTITATLVYYPSISATALQVFPGGLDNVIQTNGAIGAFITGGFLALEITDSSGKVAASVSGTGKQITLTAEIATTTMNPDTGSPVQVGDKLPLWSFDSKKGRWKRDATTTVTSGGNTGLQVSYSTNHLSYWNIDWFPSSTCNGKISFTGNSAPLIVVIRATGGWGYLGMFYQPANDSTANVRYIPSGIPITVEAYVDYVAPGNLVGSVSTTNWCGEPNRTLNLAVTIPTPTNRSVSVHYYCPTNPSTQSPAAGVPILVCRKTGSGKYRNCEPVGSTDANGFLAFAVTDPNKVTVAIYRRTLYEAVNNIIGLPNNDVCVTGGTGGTGGSGTGDDF